MLDHSDLHPFGGKGHHDNCRLNAIRPSTILPFLDQTTLTLLEVRAVTVTVPRISSDPQQSYPFWTTLTPLDHSKLTLLEVGAVTVTVPDTLSEASSNGQCRWNTFLGTRARERVSIQVRSVSTSTDICGEGRRRAVGQQLKTGQRRC